MNGDTFRNLLHVVVGCAALGLGLAGGYFIWGRHTPAGPVQVVPAGDAVDISPAERESFYHLAEGSELFPLDWLRALNSATTKKPFMDNLERFGFLPDPDNRDGLPIGMTAADSRDIRFARMTGINCAACHVNQFTYQGKPVFTGTDGKSLPLLGAPGRFDIVAFLSELAESVMALEDPHELFSFLLRWGRQFVPFAAAPVHVSGVPNLQMMASAYADLTAMEKIGDFDQQLAVQFKRMAEEAWARPGTEVTPKLKAEFQTKTPPRGPIKLQVPDIKLEDLKAFKDLKLGPNSPLATLGTESQLVAGLVPGWIAETRSIVGLLKGRADFVAKLAGSSKIKSTLAGPGRTDAFGNARNLVFGNPAIDTTAPVSYPHLWGFGHVEWLHWDGNMDSVMERNIGQALGLGAVFNASTYESTVLPRNIHQLEVIARKIRKPAWPEAVLGKLDTVKVKQGQAIFKENCAKCHPPMPADGMVVDLMFPLDEVKTDDRRASNFAEPLGKQVFADAIADVLGKIKQQVYKADNIDANLAQEMEQGRLPPKYRTTKKYAGRPLEAIWATAPYLHNNSVPTLADLLLPAAQRPVKFAVNGREYDPVKVGYAIDPAGAPQFDTSLVGNSNAGHEYGAALTDADKQALLEYLKAN